MMSIVRSVVVTAVAVIIDGATGVLRLLVLLVLTLLLFLYLLLFLMIGGSIRGGSVAQSWSRCC